MTEQSRQSQDAEAQDADEHDDWTYAARNPSRDVDLNLQPIREDFPTLRQRGVGLDQEPGIASTVQEPSTGDDQTSDHHVKFVNEFNSGHCSNPFLSPRQNHSPTATSKHNQWLDRPTKNLQRAHTNPQSSPPNQRHQVSSQYRSASFPAQNPAYQDTGSTFQYTEPRYLDPPFSQLGFSNVQKGNLNAQHTGYPQHRSPYESLHHNDSFRIPGLNEFGSDSSNLFPPSPLPGMTGQPFGAVPQFTGNAGLLHPQSGLQEIYSPGHYPGWSPVAIHDPLSQAVNQPIYSPLGHPFSPLPQQTSSHQLQDQADPSYSSFQRILPPASPTDEQVHHNSCQQLDCEKGKPKCKKGKPNNFAQNPKYGPWSNKFSTWNQARAVIKETNWITPTGDHTIPRTDEEKLEWVRRLFAAIMDGRHVHDKWHANAKNNKLLKADLEQDDVEVGCWKAVVSSSFLYSSYIMANSPLRRQYQRAADDPSSNVHSNSTPEAPHSTAAATQPAIVARSPPGSLIRLKVRRNLARRRTSTLSPSAWSASCIGRAVRRPLRQILSGLIPPRVCMILIRGERARGAI